LIFKAIISILEMRSIFISLCLLASAGSIAANIFNDVYQFVAGGGYESAPYEVVQVYNEGSSTNRYEERFYPAKKWVCSDSVEADGGQGSGNFMKLFRYIAGANEREETIEMTVPVTIQRTPESGSMNRMAMCFYLTQDQQTNPPQPNDPDLYLQDRPAMTIYTRQFGGWPSDDYYRTELRTFTDLLTQDGHRVLPDNEYRVGYQSPMQLFNRRNELWLVKA